MVDRDSLSTILIDTSTLLRARLDSFDPSRLDAADSAAIEALILFEEVLLDGPSVRRNMDELRWTMDIDDSVQVLDISQSSVQQLYERGGSFADHIVSSDRNVNLLHMHMPQVLSAEITSRHWAPSTYWRHLPRLLPDELLKIKARLDAAFAPNTPFSAAAFVSLSRLFYYLALQEQVGSALLLDPLKSFITPTPKFGYAQSIFDVFDNEIQAKFEGRKRRWLGEADLELTLPLLTRYVATNSERRGWSLGRTVTWMRESYEVHEFRRGMRHLMQRVDEGDRLAIDDVLSSLDAAVSAWAKRLDAPLKKSRLKLTVALPFVQPEFEIPVGRLRPRRPAERLLVLIGQLLRGLP